MRRGGTRVSRAEKSEAIRRALLEAAVTVVGRFGYAGASIARITMSAEVAQGTAVDRAHADPAVARLLAQRAEQGLPGHHLTAQERDSLGRVLLGRRPSLRLFTGGGDE